MGLLLLVLALISSPLQRRIPEDHHQHQHHHHLSSDEMVDRSRPRYMDRYMEWASASGKGSGTLRGFITRLGFIPQFVPFSDLRGLLLLLNHGSDSSLTARRGTHTHSPCQSQSQSQRGKNGEERCRERLNEGLCAPADRRDPESGIPPIPLKTTYSAPLGCDM